MNVSSFYQIVPAPSLKGRRVFVDARMISKTGIGTHIAEHLRGFAALGADITATVQSADDDVKIRSAIATARIVSVRAPIYGVRERFQSVVVPDSIGKQDVYWFPQYNVPYRLPRPSVITVHDLIQFRYNLSVRQRCLGFFGRHVLRKAVKEAALVICPSAATRSDLLEFASQYGPCDSELLKKTRVIRNGVSRRWSTTSREATQRVARLTEKAPYVLCVGNGKPHKNLRLVLSIGDRLATDGFPHCIVIVGPPDRYMRDVLRGYDVRYCDAGDDDRPTSSRVVCFGEVDEPTLAALYAGADLLLTPSLYEGFGLPPLEGMMAGVPVIASNRGGLPESVGLGKQCVLLDPLDLDAWHREVVKTLSDRNYWRERVLTGRQWADQMSWRSATRAFAAEILSIVEASTAPHPSRS
jgi:glycosyltransferase involved in cell wall biosynthesis